MSINKKECYLGDGLYAEFDGYHTKLYTQSGDTVYLDPSVTNNFLEFTATCWKKIITISDRSEERC